IRRVFHYEMGRIDRRDNDFEGYIEDMLKRLDLEVVRGARFKLLVDYNNGASAQILPRVLQEMSCDVIPLNAAPEETVSEQDEPGFQARLKETGVIVKAVKANLGVFIDS